MSYALRALMQVRRLSCRSHFPDPCLRQPRSFSCLVAHGWLVCPVVVTPMLQYSTLSSMLAHTHTCLPSARYPLCFISDTTLPENVLHMTLPPFPCPSLPPILLPQAPRRLAGAPALRVQQPTRRMAGGHATPRHQDAVHPPHPNAM